MTDNYGPGWRLRSNQKRKEQRHKITKRPPAHPS